MGIEQFKFKLLQDFKDHIGVWIDRDVCVIVVGVIQLIGVNEMRR